MVKFGKDKLSMTIFSYTESSRVCKEDNVTNSDSCNELFANLWTPFYKDGKLHDFDIIGNGDIPPFPGTYEMMLPNYGQPSDDDYIPSLRYETSRNNWNSSNVADDDGVPLEHDASETDENSVGLNMKIDTREY